MTSNLPYNFYYNWTDFVGTLVFVQLHMKNGLYRTAVQVTITKLCIVLFKPITLDSETERHVQHPFYSIVTKKSCLSSSSFFMYSFSFVQYSMPNAHLLIPYTFPTFHCVFLFESLSLVHCFQKCSKYKFAAYRSLLRLRVYALHTHVKWIRINNVWSTLMNVHTHVFFVSVFVCVCDSCIMYHITHNVKKLTKKEAGIDVLFCSKRNSTILWVRWRNKFGGKDII